MRKVRLSLFSASGGSAQGAAGGSNGSVEFRKWCLSVLSRVLLLEKISTSGAQVYQYVGGQWTNVTKKLLEDLKK